MGERHAVFIKNDKPQPCVVCERATLYTLDGVALHPKCPPASAKPSEEQG